MTLRLPVVPQTYNAAEQQSTRRLIEAADGQNFKKRMDVKLLNGEKLILMSPNGTLYYLTVSNAGVLTATAV